MQVIYLLLRTIAGGERVGLGSGWERGLEIAKRRSHRVILKVGGGVRWSVRLDWDSPIPGKLRRPYREIKKPSLANPSLGGNEGNKPRV